MSREKPVVFRLMDTRAGGSHNPAYEIKFEGPDGDGKIKLEGHPPQSDTDLLRAIVAHSRFTGSRRLAMTLQYLNDWHTGCTIRGRKRSYGEIKNALEGKPDTPDTPPPDVFTKMMSRREASYTPFATFNNCPHLVVDAPNGNFTITVRTSEGKRITFAFNPYQENGPAQCVDILHHDSGVVKENGDTDCPVQEVIAFTVGNDLFRSKLDDKKPCTLLTVLLATKEERAAGKQG